MINEPSRIRTFSKNPTIGEIREHLQLAIEIEHATIPAYMTALFSLKDGSNPDAAHVIRTVAIEEMLHMSLAANVLNAIGGRPAIKNPAFVPEYPTTLPHFIASPCVQIEPFSRSALRTFLRIEWRNRKPPGLCRSRDRYRTIGEFYAAIEGALEHVCKRSCEAVIFSDDTSNQITPDDYYGSEGGIVVVRDLKTALEALQLIVAQGEGDWGTGRGEGTGAASRGSFQASTDEPRYVAHLYRFYEIYEGRYYAGKQAPKKPPNLQLAQTKHTVDLGEDPVPLCPKPTGPYLPVDWDAVWPIRKNPKAADYPRGSAIRDRLDRYNRAYTGLLERLDRAFNGEPALMASTVPTMYELKYLAQELCRTPSGDGGTTVGPSWEFLAD